MFPKIYHVSVEIINWCRQNLSADFQVDTQGVGKSEVDGYIHLFSDEDDLLFRLKWQNKYNIAIDLNTIPVSEV